MTLALHGNFASASGTPWPARLRAAAMLALELVLFAGAFFLALALRFDFSTATFAAAYFWPLLPLVVGLKLIVWLALGLHRPSEPWRYTSLRDALGLMAGTLIAVGLTIAAYDGLHILSLSLGRPAPHERLPETLFILDALLACTLVTAARLFARLWHEESRPIAPGGVTRLLIVGAGEAAAAVLREIARMPERRYRVAGLLDDDPHKAHARIQGVPVLGPISALPRICRRQQIGEILIALPSASNQEMQRIVTLCRATQMEADTSGSGGATNPTPIRFRTIPSLQDILAGKASATMIRDISVADVLGRDAVEMDLAAVGAMIHGQTVLVSGAGGSIGSELCRTLCRFGPATLVLLDKAENAIFEIERELKKYHPALAIVPAIGDISDPVRVEQIFNDFVPSIVFHAAAHKHVPLAECNPGEAIRNNVFGTKTLADAALAAGVKHFVMISTDKAVNPTSIMGATKRCAEVYIQALAHRATRMIKQAEPHDGNPGLSPSNHPHAFDLHTNFITVRFGNVLGSNGSVVPIFKQQIAAGGPVTVTHPEMRRYFMTIPEAAQLVLQAGALGQRGEIFVLDMGKPVRVLDLARDLIILSGLRPEIDIPIVFTGLRPGEKLYEELSIKGENMAPTRHAKIAVWKSTPAEAPLVNRMIDELEPLQHCTDRQRVLETLKAFVPEMQPWQPSSPSIPAPNQIRHAS